MDDLWNRYTPNGCRAMINLFMDENVLLERDGR